MPSRPAAKKENRDAQAAASQDAEEEAQAESLLAEVMCGTPRARPPPPALASSSAKKQRPSEEEEDDDEQQQQQQQQQQQVDDDEEEDVWEPECIMARRRLKPEVEGGPPGDWQYLVRWVGKPESENRWVPEHMLDPDFVRQDLDAAATERAMESARISEPGHARR